MPNVELHTFDVGTKNKKEGKKKIHAGANATVHPAGWVDVNKFHFMPGRMFTEDKRESVFNYQRQI